MNKHCTKQAAGQCHQPWRKAASLIWSSSRNSLSRIKAWTLSTFLFPEKEKLCLCEEMGEGSVWAVPASRGLVTGCVWACHWRQYTRVTQLRSATPGRATTRPPEQWDTASQSSQARPVKTEISGAEHLNEQTKLWVQIKSHLTELLLNSQNVNPGPRLCFLLPRPVRMKKRLDTALWIGHTEFQEAISELTYDFLLIKSKH